ncbi:MULTISPECIES: hypothetical protein [unclassified Shinella]|uniref:hypothetical protein n=1 Tax=unclassified Shinella TaxID=2643062 RepID=UPI00225C9418|nr:MULTISPECIES: hypothetical protein [unclassified Shinella]MCO5140876.1 hypothetical protein [Shinella sp.]MDC7256433.1 hypothetical protein [Shinella sp. YE25]CAI0339300.1 conserved hypothetical protein [Rhizobiaceae bacterium]CAK7257709.1 Head decoration protein [Shinella sp. WSC3-e]
MPTNTRGSTARDDSKQLIHYLRKGLAYNSGAGPHLVGTIPAGALILKPSSGVHVVTAANAGTNKQADVGTLATADLFGTDLSLAATNFVPLDEAVGGYRVAADTEIYVTLDITGSGSTAGDFEFVIAFIPDNDR